MFNYRQKLKKFVCSCLLIVGCLVPAINGLAADTGSIKISYHGRTNKETVTLSETPFALYYAGFREDGEWNLDEKFQGSGVSLKNEAASDRKKQAELLYAYAVTEQIQGTEQKTDELGITKFENLKKGLYLVAQTQEARRGNWIFRSSPFLISIPGMEKNVEVWDIITVPKSEWTDLTPGGDSAGGGSGGSSGDVPDPDTDWNLPETDKTENMSGNVPKTGDSSSLEIWLLLFVLSAVMTGILYWRVRYRRNEEI